MSEMTITSADGTRINCEQSGSGSPLVLVHAGFVDRTFWGPSLPLLAQHFTVYAMDRRGHGRSDGYSADHAIEREYEDVLALIAAVDAPLTLVGHSSGALVALHAARRTTLVQHLVLYEPPRLEAFTPELGAHLHARLLAGDLESLVTTVLLDVVGATTHPDAPVAARQERLLALKHAPIWLAALRNARSIPAEADSYATYRLDPAEFREFTTPTTLLVGSTSSPVMQRWVAELHAALVHSHIMLLEGQGHAAMLTAPELFVRRVCDAREWTAST
jgi:pimeloyl-ACP methyl ester carboxylesterase